MRNPERQEHSQPPRVFVQLPWSQPAVPSAHSSLSSHVWPSPSKPAHCTRLRRLSKSAAACQAGACPAHVLLAASQRCRWHEPIDTQHRARAMLLRSSGSGGRACQAQSKEGTAPLGHLQVAPLKVSTQALSSPSCQQP